MRQLRGGLSLAAIALAELTYPQFANVTHSSHTYPIRNVAYSEHQPTPSHPGPYTMHRPHQADSQFETHSAAAPAAAAAAPAANPPSATPKSVSSASPANMPSTSPSSASALHEMVPITYEMLTEYYARFPSPSIDIKLSDHLDIMITLRKALLSNPSTQDATAVNEIMSEALPTSLDNSMYCLRCACEEAAQRAEAVPSLSMLSERLLSLSNTIETFQSKQSQHVSEVINGFLPQDFRATFFNTARQHSEKSNATAIKDLVAAGGSVRDKYKLLWEQQWKRRETLASVGNATGMWKLVVKYLAGVPEPLLQFAREINSPRGPTEALRNKFGSALSQLTNFAVELNAFCAAAAIASSSPDGHVAEQVERGIACYEQETLKFVQLLEVVITNSPFFVQPEEIAALKTDISS